MSSNGTTGTHGLASGLASGLAGLDSKDGIASALMRSSQDFTPGHPVESA